MPHLGGGSCKTVFGTGRRALLLGGAAALGGGVALGGAGTSPSSFGANLLQVPHGMDTLSAGSRAPSSAVVLAGHDFRVMACVSPLYYSRETYPDANRGGCVAAIWDADGNADSSFALYVLDLGQISILRRTTAGAVIRATSTATLSLTNGPNWIRADVSPRAGTVTFYSSPAGAAVVGWADPSWVQLGSTITGLATAATAAVSATPFTIGHTSGKLNDNTYGGNVYYIDLQVGS